MSQPDINQQRIDHIQKCFGTAGIPLLRDKRVLIAEGELIKVCRKKHQKRQFFLFNDLLVYGSIIAKKKSYNNQVIIELEGVKASPITNESKAFQVTSPKKSFVVHTNTELEARKWIEYINRYAEESKKKVGGSKNLDGIASPVWVPDSKANSCMVCRKNGFTVVNRRHHCRKCGRVVCQACSNQKYLLPEQSRKPLRVCIECFEKLKAESMSAPADTVTQDGSSSSDDNSDYEEIERRNV